jgi:hypothetical protein
MKGAGTATVELLVLEHNGGARLGQQVRLTTPGLRDCQVRDRDFGCARRVCAPGRWVWGEGMWTGKGARPRVDGFVRRYCCAILSQRSGGEDAVSKALIDGGITGRVERVDGWRGFGGCGRGKQIGRVGECEEDFQAAWINRFRVWRHKMVGFLGRRMNE